MTVEPIPRGRGFAPNLCRDSREDLRGRKGRSWRVDRVSTCCYGGPIGVSAGSLISMNKKIALVLLCVGTALLIAYVVAGPFITMHRIREALASGDSDALAANIEFPALRDHLKEQLNSMLLAQTAKDLKGNPFAGLGTLLVTRMAEAYVDAAVTPAGLSRLMSGRRPEPGPASEPPEHARDVFRGAHYSYRGLSRFYASVPTVNGANISFEFTRYDLSWRLTDIQMPLDAFANAGHVRGHAAANAPATDEPAEQAPSAAANASSCLKLENVDSSVLSKNDVFTEVAWKADVVNSCSSSFQASVKFSLYDKDDFELESDDQKVVIPASGTGKARGKMLVSPPEKAARMTKGSASLSVD
jgi:hypothetical protein